MPSIIQLQAFLLLALATFALGAPSPEHAHIQKRSFKVDRIPNPNYRGRTPGAGTRALVKAYRKFSIPLPPGLVEAMNAANAANAAGAGAGAGAGGAAGLLEGLLGGNPGQQAGAGTRSSSAKAGVPKATIKPSAANGTSKATGTGAGSARPSTSIPAPAGNITNGGVTNNTVTGKVVAIPTTGDVEYISPIQIGGQTINVDFDSGSSDLWVFNTQLPAAAQAGHTNFDPAKSSTFKPIDGATFSVSYGDGSGAAGNVGTDTVNIGGATVTSQAIELATALSPSFVQDTDSNGLLGLAFSKLNTVKPVQQKTFFDNIMPSLAMPVFTADLRKGAAGAYEFGNIDSTKFNGSISWAPINTTRGFWQFSSSQFIVGAGAPLSAAGGQAIADTGTTLMLANEVIINAYYSQVTGAVNNQTVGGVTFPCNAVLPDLQIDVGGAYMALIRGTDINFAPVDAAGTTCFGGIQATPSLQIYGDIMFKSQFVVFNGGNNTIGMAPHQ